MPVVRSSAGTAPFSAWSSSSASWSSCSSEGGCGAVAPPTNPYSFGSFDLFILFLQHRVTCRRPQVIVLAEAGTTWSMPLRYGGAVPATTTEPMARTLRVSRSRPGMLVSAGESAWRIVLWFAFRPACHLPGVDGAVPRCRDDSLL